VFKWPTCKRRETKGRVEEGERKGKWGGKWRAGEERRDGEGEGGRGPYKV